MSGLPGDKVVASNSSPDISKSAPFPHGVPTPAPAQEDPPRRRHPAAWDGRRAGEQQRTRFAWCWTALALFVISTAGAVGLGMRIAGGCNGVHEQESEPDHSHSSDSSRLMSEGRITGAPIESALPGVVWGITTVAVAAVVAVAALCAPCPCSCGGQCRCRAGDARGEEPPSENARFRPQGGGASQLSIASSGFGTSKRASSICGPVHRARHEQTAEERERHVRAMRSHDGGSAEGRTREEHTVSGPADGVPIAGAREGEGAGIVRALEEQEGRFRVLLERTMATLGAGVKKCETGIRRR